MRIKSSLLCGVAAGVFVAGVAGTADARTAKSSGAPSATQQQIDELREQLQFLKERLDEQAQISIRADADLKAAQADAEAARAEAAQSAAELKAAQAQAIQTIPAEVKSQVAAIKPPASWADSTSISGRMYYNLSSIEQKSNGKRVAPSGVGFDVKRFYLGVDHRFNSIFSANLTTDFNYQSALGQTSLFVKKAYLQAKFSDALVLQAGASDMPWIPFMENLYGNRYVEQTVVDRTKFGASSDWGLHANGKFGPNAMFNYDVAVVDGAGYKNPQRSEQVDVEGRFNVNLDRFTVAVGGYTGRLGKRTEGAATRHDATRLNVAAAYVDPRFRLGGEWFQAENWNTVASSASDRSEGYSVFGTYYFMPRYAVFANYQWVQPSKRLNAALKDNYFNVGVSYSPAKIVDVALVYKRDRVDHGLLSTGNGTIAGSHDGLYDEIGIFTQLRW